ncbi:Flp pilus assembly protein CpaB [Novosphingobium pentaromativorans]|uniref:Pilus assembly protein CpaB n=1 Tax=Novosphingobium pentaromativorans US6-1 TaxID=1088721 RepID=G6E8H8_9SPHN|nr:Flp pilus assembly protein CpaB [Novosphingobium pentaromativorans]AIT81335.1 pilus assembly protein CpaB [Novosphingobium pentaromativorans US6-1]EHJ62518.1 pilus assembly protein CpaB [Novosphingobium pentaromativorans US6-1]
MDKKKLVLLVVALLIAAGTAFVARSMFAGASAPQADAAPAAPTGPKVLVAQRALPVGTIITADAISFQDWPSELVKDAYFIDGEADMSKLLGTVVRFPLTAGQPVTQGSLVAPGDRGFLAAALGPGMRAVTIPVSAKTGVGGFVFPGDRVDLVLTQQVKGEGDPLRTSETILRNLRVLATDQTTDNEVVDGKTVVKAFRTVTIEVTPRIAEKVAVAQEIGTLSLSLRSIADSQGEFERILANGEVNVPEGATKEQENQLVRQAMERPIEGNTTYVTGGDVSRFQRSSRPMTADERAARSNAMAVAFSNRGPVSDAAPVRSGPVVRVTRGKTTTAEVVGAK